MRLEYDITGDASGLIAAIDKATAALTNFQSQVKQPSQTVQFDAVTSSLDKLATKLKVADGNAELFGNTLKNNRFAVNAYQSALNSLLANGISPLDNRVQSLKGKIDDLNDTISKQKGTSGFGNVGSQIGSVVNGYLSLIAVVGVAGKIISSNAEISDSLADVRRTAGLTAIEAENLSNQLKKIDTRTSLKGLLDIAVIGGQLGIAKDQLAGFTKAIDQLSVVLSGEISGGAEAVASSLGKINGVFKVQQTENTDVETSFNKTGSAILALGQAGLATGQFLQDFTLRTAGVAQVAKISLPTILAYGAVLEETGSSAEVAGTALNRLIGNLAAKNDKFFAIAKIADAKLTLEDFTKLINTDANAALLKFFAGLNAGGKDLTTFTSLINEIGLRAGPAKNAIIALAQNQQLLSERVKESVQAYNDGTLAAEQFAIKNDTLGAQVEKLENAFVKATTSGAVGNFFKSILFGLTDATNYFASLVNSKGWTEFWDRFTQTTQRGGKTVDLKYQVKDDANAFFGSQDLTKNFLPTVSDTSGKDIQKFVTDQLTQNAAALKNLREVYKQLDAKSKIEKLDDAEIAVFNSAGRYITAIKAQSAELQKYVNQALTVNKKASADGADSSQGIIAALEAQIKALKEELPGLKTKAEISSNVVKTKQLEAQLDEFLQKNTSKSVSNYKELANSVESILNKTNQLGNSNGLTGYAGEVAKVTATYENLITQINGAQAAIDRSKARGTITGSQANKLTGRLAEATDNANLDKQAALDTARINEANKTAQAIQQLNDEFGVRDAQSKAAEVARVQRLYDKEIADKTKGVLTLEQIEQRYQDAIAKAGGSQKRIDDAKIIRDAEIQQAQDSANEVIAITNGKVAALASIEQKYAQIIADNYNKIADLAQQNANALADTESDATGKIVLEYAKRQQAADKYFADIRKAGGGSAGLDALQSQFNAQNNAAELRTLSIQLSKPFSEALQGSINTFADNFYTAITTLGAQRQAIDDKYKQQLDQATDDSTRRQIEAQKQLELSATTSFGAIFSSLVSSATQSFSKSLFESFTKRITEDLGNTLIKPNADQFGIKASGADFSGKVGNAGDLFVDKITEAANIFTAKATGQTASGGLSDLFGGSGTLSNTNGLGDSFDSNKFSNSIGDSGVDFNKVTTDSIKKAAAIQLNAANQSAETQSDSTNQLSSALTKGAAALSVAGNIISGITPADSALGQGIGGALSGAGEGALLGSALGPEGALAGGIIGGLVGAIGGIFGASSAKKREQLQAEQLKEQQRTNELIARQNALAYTSSIIGRMTDQGIITGVDINAFGQLTATVSGKDIKFVLDRSSNR